MLDRKSQNIVSELYTKLSGQVITFVAPFEQDTYVFEHNPNGYSPFESVWHLVTEPALVFSACSDSSTPAFDADLYYERCNT